MASCKPSVTKLQILQNRRKRVKRLIKSASGSFGQLGILTSLTFKLDQMTHAKIKPLKPRLALTVPPPEDYIFPTFLPAEIMAGVTPEQLRQSREQFFRFCATSYYSEWFWFSLHPNGWVNCWNNDGDAKISQPLFTPLGTKIQILEELLAKLGNHTLLRLLPAEWQTILLSDAAMLLLPGHETRTAPVADALHFRRGIHNMPVQDMEFEIPIPATAEGLPDFSICQRAWWDAIVTLYEWKSKFNKIPMRLPLEMRIMSHSDVTMAAQHGNTFGTCSIEVLTLETGLVNQKDWLGFMQAVADKWASYTDAQGKPLNIRPHWAKQWSGLTIQRKGEPRKDILTYLREIYGDAIQTFNQDLTKNCREGRL